MKITLMYARVGWRFTILMLLMIALMTVAKPSKALAAIDPCLRQCAQEQLQCTRACQDQLALNNLYGGDPTEGQEEYDACFSSCQTEGGECSAACPPQ
jgi:hypothetical protein